MFSFSFAQTQKQLEHLDSYYEKALVEWNIPGMAIAIVNKDSVIFSKGYGFANIELKQKVDGNTLFAIASNTKAFTASALAQLVEQKQIKWTDKVVDYLPNYRLYDEYTTLNTTIEDLLCHRNGLKTFSGDLLWYATTKTPSEIIEAQKYLTPTSNFRTKYGYSNISYLAAGMIIEKVTDTSWADYISTHFLKPLEMNRTLTSTNEIKNTTNAATPYFYENGTNHELQWTNWDNIAPAGAIISSVNDHSKWLMLNLNKGRFGGKEYFSSASFNNLATPRINFEVKANNENVNFKAYALGWSVQDYQGFKIIGHGGGYDGMISKSTFVPDKGIGIVVLTNSLNWLPGAIVNKTLDVLLVDSFEGKDWSAIYLDKKNTAQEKDKASSLENEALRGKLGANPIALNKYVGVYKDKMYGTTTISLINGKLHLSMDNTPIFKAILNHWNHSIFTFRFNTKYISLPEGKLWFDLDKNGEIESLHIDIPNPDFFFTEFEFIKQ